MIDSIDERLNKLIRDFDELLGKRQKTVFENDINNLDRLIDLGLTTDEAKYWLEQEPNFMPSDDSYHEPSNRRKVTRTVELLVHLP
jgi:hypothetical protein